MIISIQNKLLLVFVITVLMLLKSNLAISATSGINFEVFSTEDGLPNSRIHCTYQDKKGWIWIGTNQGLSRFDGYKFLNFVPDLTDSASLKGGLVRVIKEDKHGNLLIGTEKGGLNVFDREKERFYHPIENLPEYRNKAISINDISEDKNGLVWMGTDSNILILDTTGNIKTLTPNYANPETNFEGSTIGALEFDNYGNLWVGTNTGLYLYDPLNNKMKAFNLPYEISEKKDIQEIYRDEEGLIWIGTHYSGLFVINPKNGTIQKIILESEDNRSKTVRAISKGIYGEYWIGTRGGLYKYSKSKGVIDHYTHSSKEPKSLSNTSILSIFMDSEGETWIGTRSGLNLLAKGKQVFHNYIAIPGEKNYLNSGIIYAFWIDREKNIWIGTEDGGINIYNPKTKTYEYLMADENDRNSISTNCIKAFLDDKKGNLWVGSVMGGIDIINLKTRKISHFKHEFENPKSLSDNNVWDFAMDKDGEIWVATTTGISKFNFRTNTFEYYPELLDNQQAIWIEFDSDNNLWAGSVDEIIVYNKSKKTTKRFAEHSRSMLEDSNNRIWIATNNKGIAIYSPLTGPVAYYDEKDGLANNQALCILEDNKNNLWISTNNGLSKMDTQNNFFQNFSDEDGLSNNQFSYGAAYKTKSGDLLFGSISGFNMFNPREIFSIDSNIPMVFTDFKILYKSVDIGDGKKSVLSKSISETNYLKLHHNQNIFSLEFAALNFVDSDKNKYSYMLEGFNNAWTTPSIERVATYTNLNPGDYVLHVKRVIQGYPANNNELQLNITILPPFWKTWWFLSLVIMTTIFLIYLLVRFFINREKIKSQLVVERINARKLHELDMLKLEFFTNISHEIRTPLTLILGPLNKIRNNEVSKEEINNNLDLVYRNANTLDRLISQLLDFRKLQTGFLKLNLTETDIVEFIRIQVNSFNDFADEKQINLKFNTVNKHLTAVFDQDKIEKIINNLLSNALKYTAPGGSVSVFFSLVFNHEEKNTKPDEQGKQYIEITVKDTGRGIPQQNIGKVFNRFFQAKEEDADSGTGIGLALVKELVKLHKGKIYVTSKTGIGSKFTINIPYIPNLETQQYELDVDPEKNQSERISTELHNDHIDEMSDEKIMLVIEDNADVRHFISSHFKSTYRVLTAKNGQEGWEIALKTIPDIVISDILMPVMNGYKLCKQIKNDERTSHIPVILLTAMHSKENEIKGLTTGADDYITKPFDLSVLQAKVENLLSIRELLKQKFTGPVILEPTNVEITSQDEKFLQRAIQIVEENISDNKLNIEEFSVKVGLSRMQLYRKIHALTDMTVKEFIRHIRLKRAAQLLLQHKMNISEVAYEVGFIDLTYFRKCFKREFGMSAKEYMAKEKKT